MRRLLVLASALVSMAGCTCAREVRWRVQLGATTMDAARVRLVVRRDACELGAIEHEATIDVAGMADMDRGLPPLPNGPHCFEATVVDGSCRIIGEGHSRLSLPTGGDDVVTTIEATTPFPLCGADACRGGTCTPDAGMDAGETGPDAPQDTGGDAPSAPVDAGQDAGPPPETQVFECESGMLVGSEIAVGTDPTASGGQYVSVPASSSGDYPFFYSDHLGTPPPNSLSIPIVLPHGGQWQLLVEYWGETTSSNQLWVGFGSQPDDLRGFGRSTGAWEWQGGIQLHYGDLFPLAAGADHILVVPGDVGARCDRIVLTSVPGLDAGAP